MPSFLTKLPDAMLRCLPGADACLGALLVPPVGRELLDGYAVNIDPPVADRDRDGRDPASRPSAARDSWITAAIPVDPTQAIFRSEYELEMESWLRRRFRQVCVWYLILGALVILIRLIILAMDEGDGRWLAMAANALAGAASLGTVAHFYFGRTWITATREQLIRTASLMILILGAISLTKSLAVVLFTERQENFLLPLFTWHFIACLFLPWTPRESLKPILPLLALWMLGVLALDHGPIAPRVLSIIFAPGILVPGLAVCALRLKYHGERFRLKMVGKQFFTMRREIGEARSIHESLFPKPLDDGFVRFDYTYTPQRELGGDYVHLYASPTANAAVYVTLLDVTGHGRAAALTVNRLYGELERIFGESPDAEPVDVLSLLNRYIHLTMVKHNIFVTGLCMRLDPVAGKLVWSSAGHPPALLRGVNGVVHKLGATNCLLGALDGNEFHGLQQTNELSPGDAILMYTDGAFEARDRAGQMMGLERIDALAHTQPAPKRWPQFIAAAVEKHCGGRADDDILVATMTYLAPRPARLRETVESSPLAA